MTNRIETACTSCFAPDSPAGKLLCELCDAADMWAAKDEKEEFVE